MSDNPPILTPRYFWLRDRVKECVQALDKIALEENWDIYRKKAKFLSEELLYAVTEWEKYYKDQQDCNGA